MSSEEMITSVPYTLAHDHQYNYIASFPGLEPGPTFEDKAKYICAMIKYQLLTTSPAQARRHILLKECFKFQQETYVDFCLQHKLPGTTIAQAAAELGIRK